MPADWGMAAMRKCNKLLVRRVEAFTKVRGGADWEANCRSPVLATRRTGQNGLGQKSQFLPVSFEGGRQ